MNERPMRCGDAAPYLSAFSDEELDDGLRTRLAAHLAGCAQCEAEVRRYRAIGDLVGTLPRSNPSPEVLDRVLAAVRPATPSPVTRESLLRRPRLLAQRTLPSLLRAGVDGPVVVRPIWRSRRPPTLVARTVPALAAALLVVVSVFAFSRFLFMNPQQASRPVATPQPMAIVLADTQRRASAHRSALPFAPVVPTYLPPVGASPRVTVGTEPSHSSLRYLDMSWQLALPLAGTLHIRESALALAGRTDFFPDAYSEPWLTWSLGRYLWTPGQVKDAPSRCAIGEARPGMSISVDVTSQVSGGACVTTDTTAIDTLRLTSLSLDAPYAPLTVQAPDSAYEVLHFRAYNKVPNGYAWDVYADPVLQRTRITVTDPSGASLYTDLMASGSSLTRIDLKSGHYYTTQCGCQAVNKQAQLSAGATTILETANTLLSRGELWNMGLTSAPKEMLDVGRAYELVLVGAPYPTAIYVDLSSKHVLGATVDYQSAVRPGGPRASSRLTPAGACPSYSVIQYLLPETVPTNTFVFTPGAGYTPGAVTTTVVSC